MKARLALLALAASAIFGVSLFAGPQFLNPLSMNGVEREILFSIRLPRALVAALMGVGLGASGAVLQGMLRNPLADPYILGLSSGATLLAAAGIILGVTALGPLTVPVLAFAGAVATGSVVGLLSYRRGGILPERLLLAGIGVGFLFSAVLMLLMSVSTSEGLRRAVLWMFGDLGMSDWKLIPYGLVFVASGLAICQRRAKALNSLMLGDDLAHSLGFSPRRERVLLFVAVALMTGSSVSLGGMVGFIGLLMPHIMRFFVGNDSRALVPASALAGGALLVVSDLVGRTVMSPMELPSGIVTALLGAPYFLYLLRRRDVLNS
ncbi:MAG: iron ABC transporter permease [Thermodesulfovibrionales bacterium]